MERYSERPALPAWVLRSVTVGALAVLIGAATPPGAAVAGNVQRLLVTYAGVFALVAMSVAVMSGLLATERLVLAVRHRVMAQALHRAMSLLAVSFLIAHVMVKVLDGRATGAQIVVPYVGPIGTGQIGSVGLGALASDLLLVIVVTGLLRARFALGSRPWVWRTLHSIAYVSWPAAVLHGLTSGRPAPVWALWGYVLSMVAVGVGILTRMLVTVRPRELPRRAPDPVAAPEEARGPAQRARRAEAAEMAEVRRARGEGDERTESLR